MRELLVREELALPPPELQMNKLKPINPASSYYLGVQTPEERAGNSTPRATKRPNHMSSL
eukprot:3903974-Heterocapsa_arctica.AAC.1